MQPNVLNELAARKGIDFLTLLRAVNLAWSSTRCELEGRSLEYGTVLGSFDSVYSAVPETFFHGLSVDIANLTCAELVANFGGLHDWMKSALVIDRHTKRIEGLLGLEGLKTEDPYEYISGVVNSICIVTKKAFSVRIYYDGKFQIQYIFNRKSGVIEERILEEFIPVLTNWQIQSDVAEKVLDVCLRISEDRRGALFILGSLTKSCRLSKAAMNVVSTHIPERVATLPPSNLVRAVTRDGATWIDERGLVRGHGLKFVGPGGRHAIAKYITARSKASAAVVVSQDGEITAYHQDRVRRLASQITKDNLFAEET